MKKVFKIKYILHRLINILFYLIFFIGGLIIGLMLGGGNFEKVSFIISDFFK